ncbi:hypothetical protein [Acidihalobacter ferrooxydans]|uniref:Uncharacterized protein n=1 Tax=Acidihalobacter ferrooxydans TaxID=1765967 RepID=A0A1P8UDJ9_9GAMM|nr:hypothetical protein [Acidihalobacter ferrooxydans]APZ41864.1 hypothetical protein BW247_01090 [Acidihalobacter ferrooxydans]
MTFSELLDFIEQNTDLTILKGSPADTLAASRNHAADDYAGEIVAALADRLGLDNADAQLPPRTTTINALGQTRLKYFADDAPVEGLRFVEKFIAAVDAAYNEEALREQGR